MEQNLFESERHDDTIKDQYLTFAIEDEDYGVEIAFVKEIIKMQSITKVPEMPSFIEGIINLRGDLIGVLDVRKRFGKEPKEHDEETCIIVLSYNDYTLGIIVDAVQETAIIPSDRIAPPPSAKLSYANQFVRNIGKVGDEVKLLMDVERFLAQD
ncbi:MAG: chemotaxis protein CheW [Defluviitaleaceae bacterium]|nr:chemotaxis protein CheW [Defluviitaleaceae bacterium]